MADNTFATYKLNFEADTSGLNDSLNGTKDALDALGVSAAQSGALSGNPLTARHSNWCAIGILRPR